MATAGRGLFLACWTLLAATTGAEAAGPWPSGRWRVIAVGAGLDSKVVAVEVRGERPGTLVVAAIDAEGMRLGSGRLEWPKGGIGRERWMRAGWESGDSAVVVQLRPGPAGQLTAIVRERPRSRAPIGPERVRQLTLEAEGEAPAPPEVEKPAPDPQQGNLGVFTVGADGKGLRSVAEPVGFARASRPSWSRDGRLLAFAAFDSGGRDPLIRTVPANGGPSTAIAAGAAPCWSRDGARVAYVASGRPEFATDWDSPGRNAERIEAITLNGTDAGKVETLAASGLWPRWSPTDDRLAFVARVEGNWDVYVRSADGTHLVRVTDDPALDTGPVWSADGRALIFLSDRGNRWDLYRANADGSGPTTRLTDHPRREDGADLDPGGESVAFHDRPGRAEGGLLLLDLAGGTVRRVLDPPRGDRDPAWSPDGKTLAFVSGRPPPPASTPAAGGVGDVLGRERGGRQVAGPGQDGRRRLGRGGLEAELPGERLRLLVRLLDRDREGARPVGVQALGDDRDGGQFRDPPDHAAIDPSAHRLEFAAGVGGLDLDLAALLTEPGDPKLQVHRIDDGGRAREGSGDGPRGERRGGERQGQGGHP